MCHIHLEFSSFSSRPHHRSGVVPKCKRLEMMLAKVGEFDSYLGLAFARILLKLLLAICCTWLLWFCVSLRGWRRLPHCLISIEIFCFARKQILLVWFFESLLHYQSTVFLCSLSCLKSVFGSSEVNGVKVELRYDICSLFLVCFDYNQISGRQ